MAALVDVQGEEQTIIDIRIDYSDAIKSIGKIREEIVKLERTQKNLKAVTEEDGEAFKVAQREIAKNEIALRQYKEEMRALQKETQNDIRQREQQKGSLKQMRAELSNLTKKFDELSAEQRKADLEMENGYAAQIKDLSQKLKDAEAETNRFYRNVGNYDNAVKPLKQELKEIVAQLAEMKLNGQASGEEYQRLSQRAGELKDAMSDANAEIQRMASDTGELDTILSVMTTGGGVFEVATGALELMGVATDDVEEAQKKLQATMAVVQGLTAIQNNLQKESALMLGVSAVQTWALQKAELAEAATKKGGTAATIAATIAQRAFNLVAKANPYVLLATALVSVVGALALFSKGSKEAERRQKELNAEMEATNDQIERIKSESDFNIEIAKAAGASEKAIRSMRLEAARAALALADLQLDKVIAGGGTKEQVQAAQEASQAAWDGVKKVLDEMTIADVKARNERTKNIKKTGKDAVDAQKQIAQAEQDAIRSAQDALIALMVDGFAKQRATINLQYQRTIEDLQKQLTEKGLTEKARKAIEQNIETQKQLWNKALDDLNADVIAKQINNEQERISLLLDVVKTDYLKRRELQLQQINLEEQERITAVTKEIEDEAERQRMIEALQLSFNAKRLAIEQEFDKAMQDEQASQIQRDFQMRIDASNDELETARLQMEERLALLNNMHQLEGESIEAFNQRKLDAERAYQQSKKAYTDMEVKREQEKVKAIGQAVGALGDLMEEAGENNTAAARLAKVLALAEIAINSGVAISAGIKQAQTTGPFPANIAAIATTIAAIMSGITAALKAVKGAKFAQGGTITGAGTGTSDSITARVSNGESVITANATTLFSPVLSALNQLGGGVPIIAANPQTQMGEDMLAAAVAKGMTLAPRPVVSVQEINDVERRVEVIQSIASI